MKYWILILASFCSGASMAQQNSSGTKGATPLNEANTSTVPKNTYAVVVGISDYQDSGIPDLRFADKDAEAFASYLRSSAGGKLDQDHLKILTNNKATLGQFIAALDWVMEIAKEGDLVILYFSGHGDVEKKTISQPGYLLCWDAPSRLYMGGGAFNLRDVQDIVSTLSVNNKAKVVVIADACRSGNLSGSSINGTQLTSANLAQQAANEIKILSCQPDEFSIEGEQWGGGRGAFSYNLIDALYGMADVNNDLIVNLKEVGRYLEDHVTAEVAPMSQNPKIVGNPNERIASVDAKLLTNLRSGKNKQAVMLASIDTRGLEDDVLAAADSVTRELYSLFNQALKDKKLMCDPEDASTNKSAENLQSCADNYYKKLITDKKIERLHSALTRNFAAALQDGAQQVLNNWLKTSDQESTNKKTDDKDKNGTTTREFTENLASFPRALDRAAELLGERHYMYKVLKARKYFFEGVMLIRYNENPDKELGAKALALFRESLKWQADQPQVYWQMSLAFGYNMMDTDSLLFYNQKVMDIYPDWVGPITRTASIVALRHGKFELAKPLLDRAMKLDSNSIYVLYALAIYYASKGELNVTVEYLKKALVVDPDNIELLADMGAAYNMMQRYSDAESIYLKGIKIDSTLGVNWTGLGTCYNMTKRFDEAIVALNKAVVLDPKFAKSWTLLGYAYLNKLAFIEAEVALNKAILLDPSTPNQFKHLGMVYFKTKRFDEAQQSFLKALGLNPNYSPAMLGMAYVLTVEGKTTDALDYVEQAIGKGSTFEQLEKDEDLALLRATAEWNSLMKKHFPDQFKD